MFESTEVIESASHVAHECWKKGLLSKTEPASS